MAYLKRPTDPNGAHVRIYHTLLDSPAWLALSDSSIKLYLAMRRKLTGTNNGNIEAVFSELKHRGFRSKTTMHKALRELEAVGLIAKTRQGGIAYMSRVCSLYRFTDLECFEQPKVNVKPCRATFDYRSFAKLSHAKAVVRDLEIAKRAAAAIRCAEKSERERALASIAEKKCEGPRTGSTSARSAPSSVVSEAKEWTREVRQVSAIGL